jgi:hypothetical protein
MTDATEVPERKPRHREAREPDAGTCTLLAAEPARDAQFVPVDNIPWPVKTPKRLWPFEASDVTALQWWRTLPPDMFRHAEQALLRTTLDRIALLRGDDDFAAALAGNATAAIDVALFLMPITEITLSVDIAMTAMCRSALAPNATAALVMAQIAGLTHLGHEHAVELATSWSAYGRRYVDDQEKYREAEAVLLTAFQTRQREGESA